MVLRRSILVFLLLASAALGLARVQDQDSVFNQIDSIVKSLAEISGLAEKHKVPYGRMNRVELRKFLAKRVKETIRPEEIQADELALKMFGLVPQDFDLKKSTIDLLTEQAAAFYDFQSKKLFLLEGASVVSEETTLAHELSHALADQHFNLEKFMEETPSNDDENLAHTAVVEGQASWLMLAFELKKAGQDPQPDAATLKMLADSSKDSMQEYPVLKKSPLYIQQSLLFPYTRGILFFDAVYKKLGQRAFPEVFLNPPEDSAQIIHPERYLAHVTAEDVDVPAMKFSNHDEDLTEGSVGEFDHDMLLTQYISESEANAIGPHLKGGEFKIVETGSEHRPVLEYASDWESASIAQQFFSDYKTILRKKWAKCSAKTDTASTFAGQGDNGYFVVHVDGTHVTSVEGLAAAPSDSDGGGAKYTLENRSLLF